MNRNVSIAGGLLTIIAVFLPVMTVDIFGSLSLWTLGKLSDGGHTAAYFLIICGVVIAAIPFLNKKMLNVVSLLFALIVIFLAAKYWTDATGTEAEMIHAKSGFGVGVLFLGGLLGLIGSIMGLAKKAPAPAVA